MPEEDHNPYFQWRDDDGVVWEFDYIVTQLESEGPERLMVRPYSPHWKVRWTDWADLPASQGDPPQEVMDHFFGPKFLTVTLVHVYHGHGPMDGEFWLVAEYDEDLSAYRLYGIEPLSSYVVISNPGGEDEITAGAVIKVNPEYLIGYVLQPEQLAGFTNPYVND